MSLSKMVLLAAGLTVLFKTSDAPAPRPVNCENLPASKGRPLVPTPDVAVDIYIAVASNLTGRRLSRELIRVTDAGGGWTLSERSGSASRIELDIDKCDGRVSHVHYVR